MRFAFLVLAAVLAFGGPAIAQDVIAAAPEATQVTGATIVTGQPLVDAIVPWLMALSSALIPILGTLLTIWFKQRWNVQIDAGLRDGFQTALTNGAGALIQRLGTGAGAMVKVDVHNKDVAEIITMIEKGSADAIARFALKPEDIAKRLEAKLGLLLGVTDDNGAPVVAAVSTAQEVVKPQPRKSKP